MPPPKSSCTVSSRDIQEILAAMNPPEFTFSYKSTLSPSTRQPKFYDQHMHKELLLKKVILVPDFSNFFIQCAVNTIESIPNSDRSTVLDLLLGCQGWEDPKIEVANEDELQKAIMNQVGLHPLQIASCLLFGTTDRFTLKEPNAAAFSVAGAKGKLDLYAGIKGSGKSTPDLYLVSKMLKERGGSLMAWELKGLTAGDFSTMAGIVAQEGSFQWIKCNKTADDCEKNNHWNRFRPGISGAPCGPDAPLPKVLVRVSTKNHCNLTPSHRDGLRPQHKTKKGTWILQQVWAGAVASDTTLVVIRSGSWEVYGIRIRKTQTLMISPVIDIQRQPNYLFLQAGLVIFAYRDAVKRATALANGIDSLRHLKYDYPSTKEQKSRCENTKEGPEHIHAIIQSYYTGGITKIQLRGFGSEPEGLNFTRTPEFAQGGNFMDDPQAILYLCQEKRSKTKADKARKGVLDVSGDQYRVVVKISRADAGAEELEMEYSRICILGNVPGIREGLPRSLGLYKHEVEVNTQSSMPGNYHCMWVMVWGGKDLTNHEKITPDAKERLENILSYAHQDGWAHTKITARHLLWDKVSKTTSIVSWGDSKKVGQGDILQKRDHYRLQSIFKELQVMPEKNSSQQTGTQKGKRKVAEIVEEGRGNENQTQRANKRRKQ
ncbi:hypothetical protein AX16_004962 [Volvariella volvacea WC 439]|nr:hypothetical protein AX16_004962 [Volvariella volvacea WC 439]